MEPSRPALLREITERMNMEPDLPLRVTLHARESATLLTEPERTGEEIAASDLVILSHVMLDEEAVKLEEIVTRHARPEATIAAISCAGPLMRLTRVGAFTMSRGEKGREKEGNEPPSPAAASRLRTLLRRVTGGRNIGPYLKDLIILAPKLLRLVPGKMQDLRSYIEAYLYMVECSGENVRSMLMMLADRYHAPLRGRLKGLYAAPVVHPAVGIYHPDAPAVFESREEYLKWYRAPSGAVVGLLILRGDIVMGERGHIDEMIREMERRGLGVIAAFSGSFDYRVAVERMMLDERMKGIDALVSLTAFPLVGGHLRSEPESAAKALGSYGVPYLSPIPLIFQTVDEWRGSAYGLAPVQTALHVALPELDGAIEPIVATGMVEGERGKAKALLPERTAHLVSRLEKWIALRRASNADKKIAVTIFSFPPDRGAVGTAAYLDVFRSLYRTLVRLKSEGYTVELPESPERIIEDLIRGEDKLAIPSAAELNVAGRLSAADYERLAGNLKEAKGMWGEPPGDLNSDGRDILIYGRRYGNVLVGVQPSFGFEGDPMRLLFARGATPHHGFLGYYIWLEHIFGADAHLHFGTHGALEFMPGKQVGLDAGCWPDRLIGKIPNIYLYSINNPSEGTIAKRRGLATIVSYMTPPLEFAGLYRELSSLKSMILSYTTGEGSRGRIAEALMEKVDQLHLEKDVQLPRDESEYDLFVARLHGHLMEIESRLIPTGLHVAGEAPSPPELCDLLLCVGEYDRPELGVRALTGIIADAAGEPDYTDLARRAEESEEALALYTRIRDAARASIRAMLETDGGKSNDGRIGPGVEVVRALTRPGSPSTKDLKRTLAFLLDVARRGSCEGELDALVNALAGRYIPPAAGGDPVRRPEALPSGRNIHSLDPSAVPSTVAVRNARRVVEMMLARNVEETGRLPESVGMVLWGLDNIKTHGEGIAQVFALIGVEPVADSIGRISRLRVIPLESLGRPRIDVTVQASGIFRDIFGLQIEMIDQAMRLVAALDEPLEMNHVRRRSLAIAAELGISLEDASIRLFSNAGGAYGAGVDQMVAMSAWEKREDLAEAFLRRKSFAYGKGFSARQGRAIFEKLAAGVDTTFQNLDSSEVGITDVDHYFEYLGGLTSVVERMRGERPVILVADTTTARAKVRTLEGTIRLEARTKLLNPRWYEGMLRHGYQGVEEIRKRIDYTFGFSATAGAVDGWVYGSVYETYVEDSEVRERMLEANAHAYAGIVRRLVEAHDRGFWEADDDRRERLDELSTELEDRLEGVI